MRIKLWGTRGSVPTPGPETIRYGGNTSCVGVTLSDGSLLALDAGTGIRNLGQIIATEPTRLHILLTHLHLDHIQGLVFFAPAFQPQTEVLIFTMHESEPLVRELLEAGARGYLLKSDARRFLIAAVESLARHKPFSISEPVSVPDKPCRSASSLIVS